MRPVNKGVVSKVYTDYKMAKWDLVKRLGNYCSYCEMNTDNQNDVEHVVSKSKDNSLKLSWENFLIGCKTCNIIKSDITENIITTYISSKMCLNSSQQNHIKYEELERVKKVFID